MLVHNIQYNVSVLYNAYLNFGPSNRSNSECVNRIYSSILLLLSQKTVSKIKPGSPPQAITVTGTSLITLAFYITVDSAQKSNVMDS